MSSERLQKDKYNPIVANNDATTVSVFTYRAAGTAWIIQVWKLLNGNQSPPQISSLVPEGEAVRQVYATNRSPAIAQAWETQLSLLKGDREKGPVCVCTAIGGNTLYFLVLSPIGTLCNHQKANAESID